MIGWYIHHQGRGHATRFDAVRRYLADEVTALSSLPRPAGIGPEHWLQLDRDDRSGPGPDPTAHGRLHWAPLGSTGLQNRTAAIAGWIAEHRPRAIVVDVSIEVCLLARLAGVPVIVFAGPGDRDDQPHQLAYAIADRIIAAWPQQLYDPSFLHPHADKTCYVGAFSRFDDAVAEQPRDHVLVLNGAGGSALTNTDLDAARAAVPGRRWVGLGVGEQGWDDDVWTALSGASVVVTHAGQNALAEVAAARRPAVIVPQQRPFGEQFRVAEALDRHAVALTVPAWPSRTEWPAVLDAALSRGGARWQHWSTGHGAASAAAVVNEVACR